VAEEDMSNYTELVAAAIGIAIDEKLLQPKSELIAAVVEKFLCRTGTCGTRSAGPRFSG